MSKHARDRRPHLRPVTRIELSEENIRIRWILIAVFLSIAVVSIGMGLYGFLNTQPGWNEVTVTSDQPNCGTEFTLMYDFSDAGGNASAVNKSLTELYSGAAEKAYKLFSPDVTEEGLHNLAYLNAHVNEVVTVEETLYQAFALLAEYENRLVYLAPVYREYDRIFRSESDMEAENYDPAKNSEVMAYISELVTYSSDPERIDLELLGDNQIRLNVAEKYLAFAQENGIEAFLDFGWMKNAFVADYLAENLSQQGFTNGYLASYDGFTRNLDTRGKEFTFHVFDREGISVYMPAMAGYSSPLSIVYLRDYPMETLDRWRYYAYENGEIATALIDPTDGVSKAAVSDLVSYSQNMGCADILMALIPLYLTEELETDAVKTLREAGIHSIWCRERTLYHTDSAIALQLMPDDAGKYYEKTLIE